MNKQRLIYLFQQYQTGHLSMAEQTEWNQTIKDPASSELLSGIIGAEWELLSDTEFTQVQPERSAEILVAILAHRQHKKPVQYWRIAASIAALIFILAGTGYFYLTQSGRMQADVAHTNQSAIVPGGNKAYLILADGKRIILDDKGNGKVATQFGTSITKTEQGALVYHTSDHQVLEANAKNTVQTPKGGQYQVVLPDGSHVWLNANSALEYPVAFNGANREVTLVGEAYFEVSKDKAHSFIVKTATQSVEVLGTHFNISSYADEGKTYTTLVEGSVRVDLDGSHTQLKPGEQAVLSDGRINVKNINIKKFTAWKEGTFNFNGDDIKSIMRQLQRWYDFEVLYEGNLPDDTFYGEISRNKSISQVLRILSITKTIDFQVNGRKITVTANKN